MSWSVYDAIKNNDLLGLSLAIQNYDKEWVHPIQYCAVHGTQEAMGLLIDAGFDVNEVHVVDSETPLTRAIHERQDFEMVKFLIENGANVNHILPFTPIMAACNVADRSFLELLLESGASIDLRSTAGKSALMHCALTGRRPLLHFLIMEGANMDLKDKDGDTALHCALMKSDIVAAKILIRSGANTEIMNLDDHTPLDIARMYLENPVTLDDIEQLLVP